MQIACGPFGVFLATISGKIGRLSNYLRAFEEPRYGKDSVWPAFACYVRVRLDADLLFMLMFFWRAPTNCKPVSFFEV